MNDFPPVRHDANSLVLHVGSRGEFVVGHTTVDHLGRPAVTYNAPVVGDALARAQYPIADRTDWRIPLYLPASWEAPRIPDHPLSEVFVDREISDELYVPLDSAHALIVMRPLAWPLALVVIAFVLSRSVIRFRTRT
jgi:hypothetical protein